MKNLILLLAVLVAPVAQAGVILNVETSPSGVITNFANIENILRLAELDSDIQYKYEFRAATNATWIVSRETPEIEMTISTNVTTKWTTVEEINDYAPAFTISRFDLFKQVGQTSTNRVLTITHEGATNLVVLKVLGKQEWPMEKRVLTVPARYRPFQ